MDKLVIKRYSPSFKLKVINEIADGKFPSFQAAQEHYGIGGSSTIKRWLVQCNRKDLIPRVVVVDV